MMVEKKHYDCEFFQFLGVGESSGYCYKTNYFVNKLGDACEHFKEKGGNK